MNLKKIIYNVMKLSSIQMDLEYTFLNIIENNSLSGLTDDETIWNLLKFNKKSIINKEKISLLEFHKQILKNDDSFTITESIINELENLFNEEKVDYELNKIKNDIYIDYKKIMIYIVYKLMSGEYRMKIYI